MVALVITMMVVTMLVRVSIRQGGQRVALAEVVAAWLDRRLLGGKLSGTLETAEGLQAWELLEGLGDKAPVIQAAFRQLLLDCRIPKAELLEGDVQIDGYTRPAFQIALWFRRAQATVVVYIGQSGADLQISAQTFSRPTVSPTHVLVLAGIVLMPLFAVITSAWPEYGAGAIGLGLSMALFVSIIPAAYFSVCRRVPALLSLLPKLSNLETEESRAVVSAAYRCALQAADSVGIPPRSLQMTGKFGGDRERLI